MTHFQGTNDPTPSGLRESEARFGRDIIRQYDCPNLSVEEIRQLVLSDRPNPVTIFSDRCRDELADVQAGRSIQIRTR